MKLTILTDGLATNTQITSDAGKIFPVFMVKDERDSPVTDSETGEAGISRTLTIQFFVPLPDVPDEDI